MGWLIALGVWLLAACVILGLLYLTLWLEDRRDARRDRRPGYIIDGPGKRGW